MTDRDSRPRRKVSADELLRRFGRLEIGLAPSVEQRPSERTLVLRWETTGDPDGVGDRHNDIAGQSSRSFSREVLRSIQIPAERLVTTELECLIVSAVRFMLDEMSMKQTTIGQIEESIDRGRLP